MIETVSDEHVPDFVQRERYRSVELGLRVAPERGLRGRIAVSTVPRPSCPSDRPYLSFCQVYHPEREVLAVQDVDFAIGASPDIVDPVEPRLTEVHGIRLKAGFPIPDQKDGLARRVEPPHPASVDFVEPDAAFIVDHAVARMSDSE